MSWKGQVSIKLAVANKIFSGTDIQFEELEFGGYRTVGIDKQMCDRTLTGLVTRVISSLWESVND